MGTKAGELREMLITAMEDVRTGKLKPTEAKALAGLAQQVHASLQTELDYHKVRILARAAGRDLNVIEMGTLQLGHEEKTV